MRVGLLFSVVMTALLMGSSAAQASVLFDIGANGTNNTAGPGNRFNFGSGYGTDANEATGTKVGATFSVSGTLPSVTFSLDVGDSQMFKFGTIVFNEPDTDGGINAAEAAADLSVTAYLTFDLPPVGDQANPAIVAVTGGLIADSGNDLTFQFNAQTVTLGNGTQFSVDIQDLNFTTTPQTQQVQAVVTLLREGSDDIIPVPEPATLCMWGLGLGIAGMVRLTRRKK